MREIFINNIKLHEGTRNALLALGCDLKFYEWGKGDPDGVAKRGEPCYQILFPKGSKIVKSLPEYNPKKKRKHNERGQIWVPHSRYSRGVIVTWAPHDALLGKPGIIISFREAIPTVSSKSGYKTGHDLIDLQYMAPIGKEINDEEDPRGDLQAP